MRVSRGIVVCLLAGAVWAPPASASISSVSAIDGPSADIVDFGGSAMAPDGTGGVVYRKRVDGKIHVFAAQFDGDRWRAPQRIDNGQRFDSSWPAIGAGNGGRLVVSWVQEFGPSSDRMYSAGLDPGARRFQAPVPIDLNVGESTGTWPSLAMNAGGTAYIAYLVMQPTSSADPPGYARGELRVARYDATYWSGVGFPLNRNPVTPLRIPSAGTGPRVTIDSSGNGILGWQEPDDGLIDRIWARRLFTLQTGIALQVSPGTWNQQPLRAPADAFALDAAGFGQGAIAFRQQPAQGGPLAGTRIMLSTIPETSSPDSGKFGAPRIVDGAAAPAVPPGPPSVGVDGAGNTATAFGFAQRGLLVGADDRSIRAPDRLDDGRTTVPGDPEVDLAGSGAEVAAWLIKRGASGGIGVTERRADGVPTSQAVSAPAGGAVAGFALAGSGLGDAVVGWAQGGASRQVAALVVDAPPDPFAATTPADFVRRPPKIEWDVPAHAIGGVKYALTIDDETVAENLRTTRLQLRRKDVEEGIHVLQVVAEDPGGQETTSFPADLKFDSRKPKASVKRFRNGLVIVRLTDGARSSGVNASTVKVSWGDGKSSKGHRTVQHRYGGGAPFRLSIRARDKAGNALSRRVTVSP